MTLKRTIHRRAARKRARHRKLHPPKPSPLITPHWLIRERLADVRESLRVIDFVNRAY